MKVPSSTAIRFRNVWTRKTTIRYYRKTRFIFTGIENTANKEKLHTIVMSNYFYQLITSHLVLFGVFEIFSYYIMDLKLSLPFPLLLVVSFIRNVIYRICPVPIHVEEPLVPLFFPSVFESRFAFCLRCFLIYSEKYDKVGFDPTSDGRKQDQKKDKERWPPAWLRM